MSNLQITHAFVKGLAAEIRHRYGKEIRHTQVIEMIAKVLNRKAGPLMHALKNTPGPEFDIATAETSGQEPFTGTADLETLAGAIRAGSNDAVSIFCKLIENNADAEALLDRLVFKHVSTTPVAQLKPVTQPLKPDEWLQAKNIDLARHAELAHELMCEQLGRPWRGFESASRCGKATMLIIAMAILRFTGKIGTNGNQEQDLLNDAADSGADITPLMRQLIGNYENNGLLLKAIEAAGRCHAYENTVIQEMLRRLQKASPVAIEPSKDLRFVRSEDVTMWSGINNFNRTLYNIEGAGIIGHYKAERVVGKSLVKPYVHNAVDGLNDYMDAPALAWGR